MRWTAAFLGAAALCAAPASATELPSRQTKPPAAAKRCEIGGKPGYLALDGQTCIRFSGYVSGQVSVGTLK